MEKMWLFCDRVECQAHEGAWVGRAQAEEWIVELEGQTLRFVESGTSPICPLCGHPLLWPDERAEGTAPASLEEQERLGLWLAALPE
ncbi:hypothetical protein [Thermoflexus sp.]|uniref:hypothetical protein n=1 Tax=Thermoflexus sp. TaxID=1969742 RepID=UPI0025D1203F|nr:hypothetical protein [Thermoflexus sp.]MDW8179447.1 hypothetical protein [Anaerolineae bacterium]MCS6963650.1 hypothetical protein [Thermoflexus sp.]MCS7349999.1 hypothetical protein [Thermoflexus sp.]MCX7691269.1 hypothetical protein [Thermoflexus sp.]MDW8185555.1 hypothetical protein [Anaerolineae bacterium]